MKKLTEFTNAKDRRQFIEEQLNIKLPGIGKVLIDDEKTVHTENLAGAVSIPLGIAGPIKIINSKLPASLKLRGTNKTKNYFIPLATHEGALVASVNRGCKAINLSGGAVVNNYYIGATRGPVFYTGSIKNGEKIYQWIENNFYLLKEIAEKTSRHLKLKDISTRTLADYAFLRILFDTDQAMGMNMATIASDAICQFIEEKTGFRCLAVAGNYDIDKKPAWLNVIRNRGYKIWAESIISEQVIKRILKSDTNKIYDVWLSKCMIGSAISGSLGFNCHYANIIAAFFAATGQDLGHISEGSIGITTTKVIGKDLYISIYLPDVMIGMVGGGTKYKTQKESLLITQAKNTKELTEVLAAGILAGELSLLASLASGSLAKSHQRLGR